MYYIKRLFSMNYKQMLEVIDKVHKRSGKSKIYLFFDMIICSLKYQAGYMDYYVFNFENLKSNIRKTFITRGINNNYIRTMNNREYYHLFDNKIEFNNLFKKYLNRDYLDLNNSTLEEFETFTKKHKIFMAKPVDLQCGKGIEKIEINSKTNIIRNINHEMVELYYNIGQAINELIDEYNLEKSQNEIIKSFSNKLTKQFAINLNIYVNGYFFVPYIKKLILF